MAIHPSPGERAVFTIISHPGGWAVEHEGHLFDSSRHRDEVMAAASRRARAAHNAGRFAKVVVAGEPGFLMS
jgi:hypothetical protein